MPLYENDELLVILKDCCRMIRTEVVDEIAPRFPDESDSVRDIKDILDHLLEIDEAEILEKNAMSVQMTLAVAAECKCPDEERHALMRAVCMAFSRGGEHLQNTIKKNVINTYNLDENQVDTLFTLIEAGHVPNTQSILDRFGKREKPLSADVVVPDYIPEDMITDE